MKSFTGNAFAQKSGLGYDRNGGVVPKRPRITMDLRKSPEKPCCVSATTRGLAATFLTAAAIY